MRCSIFPPTSFLLTPEHWNAPEWQFGHRVDEQSAAVVEERAILVEELVEVRGLVIVDAPPQYDVVTARHYIQRVHLHRFNGVQSLCSAVFPAPAASWPQPLSPQHKASRGGF